MGGDAYVYNVETLISDANNGIFEALWRHENGRTAIHKGHFYSPDTTEHNYGYHYEQGIEPVNSFYENISGVWNLESFTLTDEAGNSNKLREEELVKLGIETRHEVFDGLRDYTAPGLISYELSTYSLDIGKGERNINVKATIRDDLSGVFDGRYISGHSEQVSKATWKSLVVINILI